MLILIQLDVLKYHLENHKKQRVNLKK